MYRLDQNGEFTLIRVIAVSGVWTTVTLKNGNKQLYTNYKDSRSCGRGCSKFFVPDLKSVWKSILMRDSINSQKNPLYSRL